MLYKTEKILDDIARMDALNIKLVIDLNWQHKNYQLALNSVAAGSSIYLLWSAAL